MEQFAFSTIQKFDDHISNSVVGYNDLVCDIINISDYFVEKDLKVYDLGCSTGKLLKLLSDRHPNSFFVGVENEPNFSDKFESNGNLQFLKKDLTAIKDFTDATFITSVFTMQFLSEQDRVDVLKVVYNSLREGGCFIWAEKVLSNHPKFQDMLNFLHYEHKREKFSDTEILDKEKSLRSIMKLKTLDENLLLLKAIGFSKVEIFWRRYNFVGMIAIK